MRATGADIDDAMPLARQLNNMGMPLYGAQPPTGYSMKSDAWVSSSALLERMNFALALTAGKVRGVKARHKAARGRSAGPGSRDHSHNHGSEASRGRRLKANSRFDRRPNDTTAKAGKPSQNEKAQQNSKPPDSSLIGGLLLGSPEFQRR